jgi:FdhD protein
MSDLAPELGWPSYRIRPVERWRGESCELLDDCVAEEAPIAVMYNGEPHVVMLATPLDLEQRNKSNQNHRNKGKNKKTPDK